MTSKLEKWLIWVCLGVLAYIPFHALLSTWAVSRIGHENVIEAVKDGVVAVVGLVCLILALKRRPALTKTEKILAAAIGLFTVLHLAWLPFANGTDQTLAGLIINLRFLLFFSSFFFLARQFKGDKINSLAFKVVAIAAVVVCAFGFLQATVLPKDFLRHFGYGESTIRPYQTVDNDQSTVRILSTLRGPNPLGAYLIVAGVALYGFLSRKKAFLRPSVLVVLVIFAVTLYATYSRAAWLGFVGMVAIFSFLKFQKYQKKMLYAGLSALLSGLILITAFRSTPFVQKTVFHVDPAEASSVDSDDERVNSLKSAVKSVVKKPLGHGIGSAGIASAQGNNPRTVENYFLDSAYQMGIVGLGSVVVIHGAVGYMLWQRRADKRALLLLSSFLALVGINMLWPAWSDETIAYTWWGLAGVFLGSTVRSNEKRSSKK